MNVQNVSTYFQVASCFKFDELSQPVLCYIERFFVLESKNKNFLELDLTMFKKIIANSSLDIDSELEVVKVVDNWVRYNFEERRKFASRLLSKVRLNLLSDSAIASILKSKMSFKKINGCVSTLKEGLDKRANLHQDKLTNSRLSRHCDKNKFDLMISGGFCYKECTILPAVKKVKGKTFEYVKDLDSMKFLRQRHELVYCRGAVYVFGGEDDDYWFVKTVEKYSLATGRWESVAEIADVRYEFRACAFMNYIFLMGGRSMHGYGLDSCLKFNTENNRGKEVAKMNGMRQWAGCAVYEGRVVVSGGNDRQGNLGVNTVEAYDHISNKWSSMPNMIEGRSLHRLVAVRNKLFVIDFSFSKTQTSEVYDSTFKNFVYLKQKPNLKIFKYKPIINNVFCIGSKLILILNERSKSLCYDVGKSEWSFDQIEVTDYITWFSCDLIPKMKF